MSKKQVIALVGFVLLLSAASYAADAPPKTMTAAQFEASLKYKKARSPFRAAWQRSRYPTPSATSIPKTRSGSRAGMGKSFRRRHPRHALPCRSQPGL